MPFLLFRGLRHRGLLASMPQTAVFLSVPKRSPPFANHAQPAAVFLLTLPETPLFTQPYGETPPLFFGSTGNAAAFSSALPEMPAAAFLFSDSVSAEKSLLFAAAPARRTVARRRSTQNAGGLQGRNFHGIARRSPRVRTGRPTTDFPRRGVCCKPFFICPFVFLIC